MASLRCSRCGQDWPVDYDKFMPCPECEGLTWWMCAGKPMDVAHSHSRRNHALFERFYEAREQRKAELLEALEFEPEAA